jgi:hypothetical protein
MTKARTIADLGTGFVNISDTGTEGTKIASGTTAQRGSTAGQLRFNTDTGLAEYFDGSGFKAIDTPPEINLISPSSIDESDLVSSQTIVITGSSFNVASEVKIIGFDGTVYTPVSTTYNNSTQITITTPTNLVANNEPYAIRITNPSGLSKEQSNLLSINDKPVFSVASGSLGSLADGNRLASNLTAVTATDEESDTITFSQTAGTLPTGITFNSNGTWSGTANSEASDATYNFTITATSGGQTATRNYSISVLAPPVISYLLVAGGGGGADAENAHYGRAGGGGGAGGLRNSYASESSGGGGSTETPFTTTSGTTYTITVGSGGSGRAGGTYTNGGNGSSSSISGTGLTTISTTGGGGGGAGRGGSGNNGNSGGSGGGGGVTYSGSVGLGGSGTANEGYAGGSVNRDSTNAGGGGGGAGQVGETSETDGTYFAGDGGDGVQSSITGSATYYAGGGGGASDNGADKAGSGGQGGGGTGQDAIEATAGTANSGGGGGGGGDDSPRPSKSGGSGVVILRLATNKYSGTTTGIPTVTTDGTDTILTFTGSGSYTA